ncbi:MAG: o-succinylbenzoate synthase, partial [Acidobacteria bacterium]
DSHDDLMKKIESELAAGYQRIKIKVKPGWDLDVLAKTRKHWPEILLSCDANSAYRPSDLEHLRKFDDFNLLMIEQPLWDDDIFHHAKLQRELKTSICLDESIRHRRDAEQAISLGACRIMNIKVGRVGGFTEAIAVHDQCLQHNIPVWCGGMLDVSASKRYWEEDIVEPEITVTAQGTIPVTEAPGTGYELRKDLISKLTVRSLEIP